MKKQEDLFQDHSPEERIEAIKNIAVKTELQDIKNHYNEDEKNQIRGFVSEESISLMEQEEEFSVIKKEFSQKTKALKMQLKSALKDLKRGYTETNEQVFLVDDQDEGLMHIFDSKGKFLQSRKLYPDERQTTIINLQKTA
jgi:hypothetical protein